MTKSNNKKLHAAAKERFCYCDRCVHLQKIECGDCKKPSHGKCAQISMEAYTFLNLENEKRICRKCTFKQNPFFHVVDRGLGNGSNPSSAVPFGRLQFNQSVTIDSLLDKIPGRKF